MTGVPPFASPYSHVKPIEFNDRWDKFSRKLIGASGLVIITPPFPSNEKEEYPYALIAEILG